jgi:hypothetical protein
MRSVHLPYSSLQTHFLVMAAGIALSCLVKYGKPAFFS